jgi:deazaflavin-dependent oxidoreductase (nitroreductase family)
MNLLSVRGRKSGQLRTTPVGLFVVKGRRYLFSTFGRVNWVYNLRASHEAVLTHGRRKEAFTAAELSPENAAPVLKDAFAPYLASSLMRPMLRIWYDATPDTSLNGYVEVAQSHPVFELREA